MREVVKTSDRTWLQQILSLAAQGRSILLVDDAGLGLGHDDIGSAPNLVRAARAKGGPSWREICGVLVGGGISGVGVWMIRAGVKSPEPSSKPLLLVAGGGILVLAGGICALNALGVPLDLKLAGPGGDFSLSLAT